MLDTDTKRRIDTARDILVGKVPDPKSQVEQITIALIYKFMDDMDAEAEELGGTRTFFADGFSHYGWAKLMRSGMGGHEMLGLYAEAITRMPENPGIPPLFRSIFNNAYLPYRDPETLREFLKVIDEFTYDHSERLGDAFEYLLSVLGSQGDAGQFRTPRHIIDFIVKIVDPKKNETVLDPACGTAGFLISSYKHILDANRDAEGNSTLTPDDRDRLVRNFKGYDISPDMVRLSLVNLYLHGFPNPDIAEYDALTSQDNWGEYFDIILANPPFMSPKGGIRPHNRFTVQSKRSEVLFVDYIHEHLKANGRAGVIVPEGIIFQSQTAYKQLRKMLVEESLVAVISLPAGVFNPYSGVKTSILILDKALAKQSDTIGFFKVENDGFGLGAQRRPIEKDDLPQVSAEIKQYLSLQHAHHSPPATGLIVAREQISSSDDYNLSGDRYRAVTANNHTFPLVSIGDTSIFRVESGGTPKSDVDAYWHGGIPWATLVDLPPDNMITEIRSTIRTISEEGLQKSSAKLLPENSVIVSTRATIGRIAINRIPIATNQGFKNIIIENHAKALPEYLALMLTKLVPTMDAWATGGTFKELSKSKFCELEVPLPPLDVQKEIVAEIEGYQKVIDGARAVVDNYRPHIPIHPDWPMVELGEFCSIKTGKKDVNSGNPDGEFPFFTCAREHTFSDVWSFDCEAILAAGNGDVGAVKYYHGKFEAYQRTYVLTDFVNVVGRYLFFYLDHRLKETVSKQKQGNTMPYIKLGMLREFPVPLPSMDVQLRVVNDLEHEISLVNANRELIERFEKKIAATIARVWGEEDTAGQTAEPAPLVSAEPHRNINPMVREMSAAEGQEMLDREARRLLGISAEEFIHAWESGQFDSQREDTKVTRLALMIPFTR